MLKRAIRHPRLRTPLAIRLSQVSFGWLLAIYLGLCSVLTILLSTALKYSSGGRYTFPEAVMKVSEALWGNSTLLEDKPANAVQFLISELTTAIGVLIPIFLLGAFVFKLFNHDPIQWRAAPALLDYRGLGPTLAFRCYNRTRSDLADVHFRVTARITSGDGTPLKVNQRLAVLSSGELGTEAQFPLMERALPTTFYAVLMNNWSDDRRRDERLWAETIVSHSEVMPVPGAENGWVKKDHLTFMVIATGTVVATGESFTSVYTTAATSLTHGNPQDIDISASERVRDWPGWHNFDGEQPIFLFVYGSLVNTVSYRQDLGYYPNDDRGPFPAVLSGYRRSWNVAYVPSRNRYVDENGAPWQGNMVALGLTEVPGKVVPGAIYQVNTRDLWRLDLREANYYRIKVTDRVSSGFLPEDAIVYTYLPKQEAISSSEIATANDTPTVRRGYVDLVNDGYQEVSNRAPDGGPDFIRLHEATFPKIVPPLIVRDLKFRPSTSADDSGDSDGISSAT